MAQGGSVANNGEDKGSSQGIHILKNGVIAPWSSAFPFLWIPMLRISALSVKVATMYSWCLPTLF